jgi:hypothetical protein
LRTRIPSLSVRSIIDTDYTESERKTHNWFE